MKINVDRTKPVIQVKPGDIAYFDHDYWLICAEEDYVSARGSLIVSLTKPEVTRTITYSNINAYFSEKNAVIYDGSKTSLNLVLKTLSIFTKNNFRE